MALYGLLGFRRCSRAVALFGVLAASAAWAQAPAGVNVSARLTVSPQRHVGSRHDAALPPAVLWLQPLSGQTAIVPPHRRYVLTQRNRMFEPHLLVVPAGSIVLFPNRDPFFHNVFSLFDGKRFDLGLYEAGSTKEVTFAREGLSYIFCNIHPEMSAVVLALGTPFYAVADSQETFKLRAVPPGEYELHVWVEGEKQPTLDKLTHRVHVGNANVDVGTLPLTVVPHPVEAHTNLFGQPYTPDEKSPY